MSVLVHGMAEALGGLHDAPYGIGERLVATCDGR